MLPRKYRKRPVVVEAWQFIYAHFRAEENKAWDDTDLATFNIFWDSLDEHWFIETLEGPLVISDGDWIIRGVLGETYPCKPDAFTQSYEDVEETMQDITVEGKDVLELSP
jgi:hypothetical protein